MMDKKQAERFVGILNHWDADSCWQIVHLCPGSDYGIGRTIRGEFMVCGTRYISVSLCYMLKEQPQLILDSTPKEIYQLFNLIEQFADVNTYIEEISGGRGR